MMMAMMIETATAVRFPPAANFCSSTAALPQYPRMWKLEEAGSSSTTTRPSPRRLLRSAILEKQKSWNKSRKLNAPSLLKKASLLKNRIRAAAPDPSEQNGRLRYHPSEDIAESTSQQSGDASLKPQETARTITEVSRKATLMLTGLINDEVHENIIWPDLPYVTDEHGSIYFQVKNDEDLLQTLTSENNFVQVIVGFDAMDMLNEMELLGPSEIDFGIQEIEDEDTDAEDDDNEDEDEEDGDYDEDLVAVLEDEDEEDDSDETLGDWAKLETMRSSHPMYFAKKLAQVASDDPIDWMEQPPAGLAIQGLIRPAFIEEHSDIQRHMFGNQSRDTDINQVGENADVDLINGHKHEPRSSEDGSIQAEELEKQEVSQSGTSFYKLEVMKIQLISAHGHHTTVNVEDYWRAQPDAIALSASKIISHFKAGGEKITQALKSLCLRCKGVQVEEAAIIDVDSLGFDLRVCSGTQIQTLRFAFASRATSEMGAERQLNDLLFPRIHHRMPKKRQSHQNEL